MASSIGTNGRFPALPSMPSLDDSGAKKVKSLSSIDGAEGVSDSKGFAQLLANKLEDLNQQQNSSNVLMQDMATGKTEDVAQTMMRIEEANVSLRMATQIRNKAIDAYQEVLRMQI